MEKSSTGLAENVAGLLCYVLGWVSGLVFILIEKENRFVRFHAIQSIYVFGVITIDSPDATFHPTPAPLDNVVLPIWFLGFPASVS